jgi:hypothetical protein
VRDATTQRTVERISGNIVNGKAGLSAFVLANRWRNEVNRNCSTCNEKASILIPRLSAPLDAETSNQIIESFRRIYNLRFVIKLW